jgi:hypothetical protein
MMVAAKQLTGTNGVHLRGVSIVWQALNHIPTAPQFIADIFQTDFTSRHLHFKLLTPAFNEVGVRQNVLLVYLQPDYEMNYRYQLRRRPLIMCFVNCAWTTFKQICLIVCKCMR